MGLSEYQCLCIARLHKQYEREKKGWSLFTSLPGDLYAFSYWQNIIEFNGAKCMRTDICNGTKFAVTKLARESLRNSEKPIAHQQNSIPAIEIKSITSDTLGFR